MVSGDLCRPLQDGEAPVEEAEAAVWRSQSGEARLGHRGARALPAEDMPRHTVECEEPRVPLRQAPAGRRVCRRPSWALGVAGPAAASVTRSRRSPGTHPWLHWPLSRPRAQRIPGDVLSPPCESHCAPAPTAWPHVPSPSCLLHPLNQGRSRSHILSPMDCATSQGH